MTDSNAPTTPEERLLVDANRNLAEALKGPLALPTASVVLAPDVPAIWSAHEPEPFLPPDLERPSVSLKEVKPSPGSTKVSADDLQEIKAVFTEPMDRVTLTTSTFTLAKTKGSTEELVEAEEVSYDPKARTATLHLTALLDAGETYKARVIGGDAGAKDLAGNLLVDEHDANSWSFTTAARSPAPAPAP